MLSGHARMYLLKNLGVPAGAEFADLVDAGGGTASAFLKQRLGFAMGDASMSQQVIAKVEAGTALDGHVISRLAHAFNSMTVALEVRDALAA